MLVVAGAIGVRGFLCMPHLGGAAMQRTNRAAGAPLGGQTGNSESDRQNVEVSRHRRNRSTTAAGDQVELQLGMVVHVAMNAIQ